MPPSGSTAAAAFRAGLVLAGLALGAVCAEAGLRLGWRLWRLAYRSLDHREAIVLYVAGESTAFGTPYGPKLSFGRIVSHAFGGCLAGRPVEVVSVARPGASTNEQYWALVREWLARPRRGVLLVYAGINESLEPPAPAPGPGARLVWSSLALSRLAEALAGPRRTLPGMGFEERLDRLLALARTCEVPAVVSTLSGNVRDFPASLGAGEAGRAPIPSARQNEAVRRAALRRGAMLTDTARLFAAASRGGSPGYDLFVDAHHPNLRGCLLMAGGFEAQLARLLNVPPPAAAFTEAEVMLEAGFTQEDLFHAHRTAAMWFLGEASLRRYREGLLREARKHLRLAEEALGSGPSLGAHRFLAALLARDTAEVRRLLGRPDEIRADREAARLVFAERGWLKRVLEESELDARLRDHAQRALEEALALGAGRVPAGPVPVLAASKRLSDRGVAAALAGRREEALGYFAASLEADKTNAEAHLARCSLLEDLGRAAEAARACGRALDIAEQGPRPYPPGFADHCRSGRARACAAAAR